MDWTFRKFIAVQMIIVCTALSWPSIAYASRGQDWFLQNQWELIVFGLIVFVPFGAWLGVCIPPPDGYDKTKQWPIAARILSGLLVGYSVAIYLAVHMHPLAITVIPPSVLAAITGPSIVVLLRAKLLNKIGSMK